MESLYQLYQLPLLLVHTPPPEYVEEQTPIDRVVCLLEVHKEVELPLPLAMYLIEQTTRVDTSGLAILEPCLLHLGCYQVRTCRPHLLEDGFLHNL